MKNIFIPMTEEVIDELNELTKDHGAALGALYDEGVVHGFRKGAGCAAGWAGAIVAAAGLGVAAAKYFPVLWEKIKQRKKES